MPSKKKPVVRAKKTEAKSAKNSPMKKTAEIKKQAPSKKKKPTKIVVVEQPPGVLLGKVEDFFAHIGVVALTLKKPVVVGDIIRIKGHTTDLLQKIESMHIDHAAVEKSQKGDGVGIRVSGRFRIGDKVYKV